jgi:hypothetical protein
MHIIAYVGKGEIIITDYDNEKQMLKEYFSEGVGRDVDDYDRHQLVNSKSLVLQLSSDIKVMIDPPQWLTQSAK